MNPTELHLFSAKEQTLLVATEPARLAGLSEDDLDELLTLVRRARNKYTKLYRRQSADLVAASSSRRGTSTSNQRTKRKAEIFEDALARVARSLASGGERHGQGTQARAPRRSEGREGHAGDRPGGVTGRCNGDTGGDLPQGQGSEHVAVAPGVDEGQGRPEPGEARRSVSSHRPMSSSATGAR